MHDLRSFCEAWDGGIKLFQKLAWLNAKDTMYRCANEKPAKAKQIARMNSIKRSEHEGVCLYRTVHVLQAEPWLCAKVKVRHSGCEAECVSAKFLRPPRATFTEEAVVVHGPIVFPLFG